MADVPDQPVGGRVEHVVQRDGQLDHPEARAEMPARHRHGVDRLGPQLVGNLSERRLGQLTERVRRVDCVEQGR